MAQEFYEESTKILSEMDFLYSHTIVDFNYTEVTIREFSSRINVA